MNKNNNNLMKNLQNYKENHFNNNKNNFSINKSSLSVEEINKMTDINYNIQKITNKPKKTTNELETNYTTSITQLIDDKNDNLIELKKLINVTSYLLKTNKLAKTINNDELIIKNLYEQIKNFTPINAIKIFTAFPKNKINVTTKNLNNIKLTTAHLLMKTLVTALLTTTTTTTILPPTPEWIKQIEESFENRENNKIMSNKNFENLNIINSQSTELVNKFGSLFNKNEQLGGDNIKKNNKIIKKEEDIINKPEKNAFTLSQTKLITTIEKNNFLETCESACTYSGKLYKINIIFIKIKNKINI